jgi:putative phosphoesterase
MRIALISDTHSHLPDNLFEFLEECDEIWHAGDIGAWDVVDRLEALGKPFRAVYGNIDDHKVRQAFPEHQRFICEGLDVWMTHIGGYPGRYPKRIRAMMDRNAPKLFISGHSHILKVMPDKKYNLLHMNPGACGVHGWHKVKTILRFSIEDGEVHSLEAVELGLRGAIKD